MSLTGMIDNFLKTQAFKLKGRLYTFTVLQLFNTDPVLFAQQLDDVIAKAPKLFDNTPVVLDFSNLEDESVDLDIMLQFLRIRGMLPVAIQGANPMLTILAQTKGMAVLHGSTSHDKPVIDKPATIDPSPVQTSKMITSPVRSGQQVVAKGGDLIITASVSPGAELLADGNIHVYGVLRGRALAGISGSRNARIFCQSLEADLVSIAGFYRLSDALERHAGACQIYLQDEHICIDPLL